MDDRARLGARRREGGNAAVVAAQQARARGLGQVGVLDSSAFASLQPGYWMVFTGTYETEAGGDRACSVGPARR